MAEKRTLPTNYREQATVLAKKPYLVIVFSNNSNVDEPTFVATNPELEGCVADGKTSEEAIENLKEARTDYIQVCLLSRTPVPMPAVLEEKKNHQLGNTFVPLFFNLLTNETKEHKSSEQKTFKTIKSENGIVEYAFEMQ
jgi:predicted RNase H-like HicB family nuclease